MTTRDKFLDWIFVILSLVGSIVTLGLGLAYIYQPFSWPTNLIIAVFLLGITASTASAYLGVIRYDKNVKERLSQKEREIFAKQAQQQKVTKGFCEDVIGYALEAVAQTFIPLDAKIRAKLFLVEKGDNLKLQFAYNMESAKDRKISLKDNKGCAGYAYHFRQIEIANLQDPKTRDKQQRETWKLEDEEIALTEDLRAIMSVPVYHPQVQNQVVAVFNVDSRRPIAEDFLKYKQITVRRRMLEHFAEIFAFLLWIGGLCEKAKV